MSDKGKTGPAAVGSVATNDAAQLGEHTAHNASATMDDNAQENAPSWKKVKETGLYAGHAAYDYTKRVGVLARSVRDTIVQCTENIAKEGSTVPLEAKAIEPRPNIKNLPDQNHLSKSSSDWTRQGSLKNYNCLDPMGPQHNFTHISPFLTIDKPIICCPLEFFPPQAFQTAASPANAPELQEGGYPFLYPNPDPFLSDYYSAPYRPPVASSPWMMPPPPWPYLDLTRTPSDELLPEELLPRKSRKTKRKKVVEKRKRRKVSKDHDFKPWSHPAVRKKKWWLHPMWRDDVCPQGTTAELQDPFRKFKRGQHHPDANGLDCSQCPKLCCNGTPVLPLCSPHAGHMSAAGEVTCSQQPVAYRQVRPQTCCKTPTGAVTDLEQFSSLQQQSDLPCPCRTHNTEMCARNQCGCVKRSVRNPPCTTSDAFGAPRSDVSNTVQQRVQDASVVITSYHDEHAGTTTNTATATIIRKINVCVSRQSRHSTHKKKKCNFSVNIGEHPCNFLNPGEGEIKSPTCQQLHAVEALDQTIKRNSTNPATLSVDATAKLHKRGDKGNFPLVESEEKRSPNSEKPTTAQLIKDSVRKYTCDIALGSHTVSRGVGGDCIGPNLRSLACGSCSVLASPMHDACTELSCGSVKGLTSNQWIPGPCTQALQTPCGNRFKSTNRNPFPKALAHVCLSTSPISHDCGVNTHSYSEPDKTVEGCTSSLRIKQTVQLPTRLVDTSPIAACEETNADIRRENTDATAPICWCSEHSPNTRDFNPAVRLNSSAPCHRAMDERGQHISILSEFEQRSKGCSKTPFHTHFKEPCVSSNYKEKYREEIKDERGPIHRCDSSQTSSLDDTSTTADIDDFQEGFESARETRCKNSKPDDTKSLYLQVSPSYCQKEPVHRVFIGPRNRGKTTEDENAKPLKILRSNGKACVVVTKASHNILPVHECAKKSFEEKWFDKSLNSCADSKKDLTSSSRSSSVKKKPCTEQNKSYNQVKGSQNEMSHQDSCVQDQTCLSHDRSVPSSQQCNAKDLSETSKEESDHQDVPADASIDNCYTGRPRPWSGYCPPISCASSTCQACVSDSHSRTHLDDKESLSCRSINSSNPQACNKDLKSQSPSNVYTVYHSLSTSPKHSTSTCQDLYEYGVQDLGNSVYVPRDESAACEDLYWDDTFPCPDSKASSDQTPIYWTEPKTGCQKSVTCSDSSWSELQLNKSDISECNVSDKAHYFVATSNSRICPSPLTTTYRDGEHVEDSSSSQAYFKPSIAITPDASDNRTPPTLSETQCEQLHASQNASMDDSVNRPSLVRRNSPDCLPLSKNDSSVLDTFPLPNSVPGYDSRKCVSHHGSNRARSDLSNRDDIRTHLYKSGRKAKANTFFTKSNDENKDSFNTIDNSPCNKSSFLRSLSPLETKHREHAKYTNVFSWRRYKRANKSKCSILYPSSDKEHQNKSVCDICPSSGWKHWKESKCGTCPSKKTEVSEKSKIDKMCRSREHLLTKKSSYVICPSRDIEQGENSSCENACLSSEQERNEGYLCRRRLCPSRKKEQKEETTSRKVCLSSKRKQNAQLTCRTICQPKKKKYNEESTCRKVICPCSESEQAEESTCRKMYPSKKSKHNEESTCSKVYPSSGGEQAEESTCRNVCPSRRIKTFTQSRRSAYTNKSYKNCRCKMKKPIARKRCKIPFEIRQCLESQRCDKDFRLPINRQHFPTVDYDVDLHGNTGLNDRSLLSALRGTDALKVLCYSIAGNKPRGTRCRKTSPSTRQRPRCTRKIGTSLNTDPVVCVATHVTGEDSSVCQTLHPVSRTTPSCTQTSHETKKHYAKAVDCKCKKRNEMETQNSEFASQLSHTRNCCKYAGIEETDATRVKNTFKWDCNGEIQRNSIKQESSLSTYVTSRVNSWAELSRDAHTACKPMRPCLPVKLCSHIHFSDPNNKRKILSKLTKCTCDLRTSLDERKLGIPSTKSPKHEHAQQESSVVSINSSSHVGLTLHGCGKNYPCHLKRSEPRRSCPIGPDCGCHKLTGRSTNQKLSERVDTGRKKPDANKCFIPEIIDRGDNREKVSVRCRNRLTKKMQPSVRSPGKRRITHLCTSSFPSSIKRINKFTDECIPKTVRADSIEDERSAEERTYNISDSHSSSSNCSALDAKEKIDALEHSSEMRNGRCGPEQHSCRKSTTSDDLRSANCKSAADPCLYTREEAHICQAQKWPNHIRDGGHEATLRKHDMTSSLPILSCEKQFFIRPELRRCSANSETHVNSCCSNTLMNLIDGKGPKKTAMKRSKMTVDSTVHEEICNLNSQSRKVRVSDTPCMKKKLALQKERLLQLERELDGGILEQICSDYQKRTNGFDSVSRPYEGVKVVINNCQESCHAARRGDEVLPKCTSPACGTPTTGCAPCLREDTLGTNDLLRFSDSSDVSEFTSSCNYKNASSRRERTSSLKANTTMRRLPRDQSSPRNDNGRYSPFTETVHSKYNHCVQNTCKQPLNVTGTACPRRFRSRHSYSYLGWFRRPDSTGTCSSKPAYQRDKQPSRRIFSPPYQRKLLTPSCLRFLSRPRKSGHKSSWKSFGNHESYTVKKLFSPTIPHTTNMSRSLTFTYFDSHCQQNPDGGHRSKYITAGDTSCMSSDKEQKYYHKTTESCKPSNLTMRDPDKAISCSQMHPTNLVVSDPELMDRAILSEQMEKEIRHSSSEDACARHAIKHNEVKISPGLSTVAEVSAEESANATSKVIQGRSVEPDHGNIASASQH